MSGETQANISAWTIDSLKEHLEAIIAAQERRIDCAIEALRELHNQRFDDQEKAMTAALAASEKAIDKAESQADKWRESANEWRGAMNDREKNFLSQDAYTRAHQALIDRMEASLKALNDKVDVQAERINEVRSVTG